MKQKVIALWMHRNADGAYIQDKLKKLLNKRETLNNKKLLIHKIIAKNLNTCDNILTLSF